MWDYRESQEWVCDTAYAVGFAAGISVCFGKDARGASTNYAQVQLKPMQKNCVIAHLLNRWGLIEHCLVKAYGEVDTAMAFGFVMRQRARRGIKCVVRLFFRRDVFERNNMSEPLKDKYVEL